MTDPNLVLTGMLLLIGVCVGVAWCALLLHRHWSHNSTSGTPPNRWWQTGGLLLWNLSVTCIIALAFVLGLELYFRFSRDTTDSFCQTMVAKRWFERHYQRNAQGVRDDIDYDLLPATGRRRITFLGDSFTAGHGVAEVNDRFLNRIRARSPEWIVYFIGDIGQDTPDHLNSVRSLLETGYKLDEVVLVYVLNDIGDLLPSWQDTSGRFIEDLRRDEAENLLLRGSYFLNTLYYRYKGRQYPDVVNYCQSVRSAYEGNLWNIQRNRLKELRDLVEGQGKGHLTVVTFPFLNELGPNYTFAAIHTQLANFWRELGVPHLDLLPLFSQYPSRKLVVNSLDAHPNEFAHLLASDAIQAFLNDNLHSNSLAPPNDPLLPPE